MELCWEPEQGTDRVESELFWNVQGVKDEQ